MNDALLIGPFVAQSILMTVDEFACHRKRSLPKWERIGHPIDTAAFLICLLIVFFLPVTQTNITIFVIAGLVSTLLITKDEWVHSQHCTGFENWLHSLLFIVHPLALVSLYAGWTGLLYVSYFPEFLLTIIGIILFFGIYQIFYWIILWKKPKSITTSTMS